MDKSVNLQKEWDQMLVKRFYSADTLKMFVVMIIFKKEFKVSDEEFNNLKRIPRLFQHRNVAPRRFVCAFLPKVADILWKHKAEESATLAEAMWKINYDVCKEEADLDKIAKDRAAVSWSRRLDKRAALSRSLSNNWHTGINRNQTWSKVK